MSPPTAKTVLSASSLVLSLVLAAPTAVAGDAPPAVDRTTATDRHLAVEVGAGIADAIRIGNIDRARFAPPLGLGSVALDLAPSKYLALNVGVGLGLAGPSAGTTVRLRMPGGPRWAFTPAVGLAWGHAEETSASSGSFLGGPERSTSWNNVVSLPIELGFERRTDWGRVRLYAGYKMTLRSDDATCSGPANLECDRPAPSPIYLGLSVAYDVR